MVDPISELGEEEDPPECVECGDPASGPGRRVLTRVEDGRAVHYDFCGTDCVRRWRRQDG